MKLISFDLDGTLTTPEFVDSVWRVGIPELFAKKHNISLQEARNCIFHEYEIMGDDNLKWYDLPFWLQYLKLDITAQQLLLHYRETIALYPDVISTLYFLRQHCPLIITSNASRLFLDMEIEHTGIKQFFIKIISATSDFGKVKREEGIYQAVADLLNIPPDEIIHIGDHWEFDFETPRKIGMRSYFLDRAKEKKGRFILHSLEEIKGILNGKNTT